MVLTSLPAPHCTYLRMVNAIALSIVKKRGREAALGAEEGAEVQLPGESRARTNRGRYPIGRRFVRFPRDVVTAYDVHFVTIAGRFWRPRRYRVPDATDARMPQVVCLILRGIFTL